ncbi:hypothetical protein DUT91_23305 [Phyllobacterium salinisoli]|uniref:Uncharacterized protein n=1 Tax=Phyllobacterium salinisoli TaxID=1899321 RepID=A0A368JWJ8_9HYPH|nr:hypothetical protein DUT91_23305 [Phyllobacterium salinisoli]
MIVVVTAGGYFDNDKRILTMKKIRSFFELLVPQAGLLMLMYFFYNAGSSHEIDLHRYFISSIAALGVVMTPLNILQLIRKDRNLN